MSCMMLGNDTWRRLFAILLQCHPQNLSNPKPDAFGVARAMGIAELPGDYDGRKLARLVVTAVYQANVRAFLARYEGRHADDIAGLSRSAITGTPARVDIFQALKTVQCICYQLAEDVDPKHAQEHERVRDALRQLADAYAYGIAECIHAEQYNAAEWG